MAAAASGAGSSGEGDLVLRDLHGGRTRPTGRGQRFQGEKMRRGPWARSVAVAAVAVVVLAACGSDKKSTSSTAAATTSAAATSTQASATSSPATTATTTGS